jgi:malonate transporter
MTLLFSLVLPVFALILIGLAARRRNLLDAAAFRSLTDAVFFIAMPALLFGAVVQGSSFDLVRVASVYFVACLTVFALGAILPRLLRFPLAQAAMLGLNASYGNTVMMGIPITVATLGPEALPPLLAIIALHPAILLTLAGVLMEIGVTAQRPPLAIVTSTLTGTLRNPVIMSIVVAYLWRALELPVPPPLRELLRLLGAAAVPFALICLGGTLPPLHARAIGTEAVIGSVLKLVLLPGLVWAVGRWADLPPLVLTVAVLTGGMPTGASAFLLARRSEQLLKT